MEEIGFDVTDIIREADYIERVLRGEQRNRLYIIPGVSEDTQFCPQTRKEIAVCRMMSVSKLSNLTRLCITAVLH